LSPLREPSVPYREVHVEGTGNVLREAEDSGVEDFVHLSALGADTDRDTDYLKTKGEAQEMVEESGTAWRIFRPSVLFGEGGEFLDFLYRFSTPLITLQPGRNTIFQPLYVGDLADMIAESLEERHSDQLFDVGGPEQIKLGEIVEAVRSSRDRTAKALELPDPLFRTFMTLSERLPFTSMGMDQYRSLQTDNVADKNDAPALGKPVDDMTRLREYLEVNS
ncbi:MAG: complex I NDUFA9 subunit family protein, partial [Candidatus Nanohaloarchaea archaeon]